MKRFFANLLMLLGALLLAAALGLFCWNRRQESAADAAAAAAVAQLELQLPQHPAAPLYTAQPAPMATARVDGVDYIGILALPALGLELPIAADWDYATLKKAPCRYTGTVEEENLVLCAHNYSRHFGRLTQLRAGDAVTFTDLDGIVTAYTVASVEVLQPQAVEDMVSSGWALTLFTCTYGGRTRYTVRCDRAQ